MASRQIVRSALFSALFAFLALIAAPARAQAPGPEVCAGCHEDRVAAYSASIHGQAGHPRSPASIGGCVACHANAAEHVKAGGGRGAGGIVNPSPDNKKMTAAAKSAICLNCHETSRQLSFWDTGRHKNNDVTCSNCHDVHGSTAGDNSKMLRTPGPSISPYVTTSRKLEYETCVTCHKDKRAQINKPSHHPILEGKVKCSDCHNPHGTMNVAMIKGEVPNDLCLGCHADKRGPWIHTHPPVEENCLTCHAPHGSNHNFLLTMKPPQLCEECHRASNSNSGATATNGHTAPLITGAPLQPGFANSGNAFNMVRFQGLGCVNCHRQIHGSNAAGASGEGLTR